MQTPFSSPTHDAVVVLKPAQSEIAAVAYIFTWSKDRGTVMILMTGFVPNNC